MSNKPVVFDVTENSIIEYAVEQYVSKIQERIADEHSGVSRFMLESNLISANSVLDKVRASKPQPKPFVEGLESPEG